MMNAKTKGFTLIEVIIGMSLLGVMMLLLFSSLRICVQNWNAGEKKIAQVSRAAIVQNFFQTKLHASLPLHADFFEEPEFSFQGDKEQLQFVAAMPSSAGRLGLQIFSISLDSSLREDGSKLTVDIQPFFPKNENEEWKDTQVTILKSIRELRFGYFGSDDFIEEPDWQDEWLEKERLPQLVSIDIELMNGEVWPQVIVPLVVNGTESTGRGSSGRRKRNSNNVFGQNRARAR